MKNRMRLGEMLVNEGHITTNQLEEALEGKKNTDLRLGEYLVQKDYCRESDIVAALSRQMKIPRYSASEYDLDLSLAGVIPAKLSKQHGAVPVTVKGSVIVAAMTDPLDIDAMDALEIYTNREIEPVVCTMAEFTSLYNTLYGIYKGLDGVLASVESITSSQEMLEAEAQTGADIQIGDLDLEVDDAPVIRLVNSIIAQAVSEKVSDIHISPEKDRVQVRFRVDGKLHDVPAPSKMLHPYLTSRIKIMANMDISVTRIPQDGRFTVNMDRREINIRASSLPTVHGENLVLRLLDMSSDIYSLDQLGMNRSDLKKIMSVIHKPYGMILSTGPTGSGKSTSLYSILKQIHKPDVNIVTLEDPVEYRIPGIRQVQLNLRAGMTFASGLRSIMRQDPDVIMVGEIRDLETAAIAVQSALTGHRVLSTVHTNDAAGAVTRFQDMGVEPFLISSVLLVTFAQRLVRRVCSNCAQEYVPPEEGLQALGLTSTQGCTFMKGQGCHQCMSSGYKGRTGIFEVLKVDEEVQDMIMKRFTAAEITRNRIKKGELSTLKDDAARKVCQGITTVEEALAVVMT